MKTTTDKDPNKGPRTVQHHLGIVANRKDRMWDLFFFLAPALFCCVTNVYTIYLTAILRIISAHLFLVLHYIYVDKDNYNMKISEKQLERERKDYLVGPILHMWAQIVLQLLFPGMFFTGSEFILVCARNTLISHILVVEPLYYFAHRWLHIPEQMKFMHGFHHLSINTLPSTSLVQNFTEHFIYIATFGPAMLLPYFVMGQNHWLIIMIYLILFDIVNAYGHTHIPTNHWLFQASWSPLKYLFYTPDFHLGHHALFNANYSLFMPYWDHIFNTFREYKKPSPEIAPANQQDFVFIGHNGGIGHFLTIPEYSIYNVYDPYRRTWLPISMELMLMHIINLFCRLFLIEYRVSRYLVNNIHIGRIITVLRTPYDYFFGNKTTYIAINNEIIQLIERQHKQYGTKNFGLGNLNKMKQLNDGGSLISTMVKESSYLSDKNIRIWTGDTLTSASIYHQLIDIPNLKEIFYIGATGKIGLAVIKLLVEKGIRVCIYSRHKGFAHELVTYTDNLSVMKDYKFVVIGKMINPRLYDKILRTNANGTGKGSGDDAIKTRYLLDYTVPFMPLTNEKSFIKHIQIGLLTVSPSSTFLKGHYDICFGIPENHIYPCHAGCLLNMVLDRKTDETGDIVIDEIEPLWQTAKKYGLDNVKITL